MAYIDVTTWSPDHVVSWLRGLHLSLQFAPVSRIIRQRVNGARLLLMSALDFTDLIPGINLEAIQTIAHGINLLNDLNHNSKAETLQSLTLNLACQARYLCNQIIQALRSPKLLPVTNLYMTPTAFDGKNRFNFAKVDSNVQINQSTKQRVSLETLENVSIIVDQILEVVNWLNSIELNSNLSKFNKDFKSILLRVAVELTSTAQRDQFVEQPNDILLKTSKFLADYCQWVVLAIDDPDFIQPCWLDVVSVKKKPGEDDFGFVFQANSMSSLSIEDVYFSSAAHRSGRISKGDDLIQIGYQTVIGWPPETIQEYIKKYTNEIILTIKKKPGKLTLNPSIVIMKPYPIPNKRVPSYCTIESQKDKSASDKEETPVSSEHLCLEDLSIDQVDDLDVESLASELPKEPKGPVYPDLQTKRSRPELKRRMSISGDISDWWFEPRVLADSLPIPSLEKAIQPDKTRIGRMSREAVTKSVSHDTAKLYLHTLSIDRKHLWMPKEPKVD